VYDGGVDASFLCDADREGDSALVVIIHIPWCCCRGGKKGWGKRPR
jgi:hypothetical protein